MVSDAVLEWFYENVWPKIKKIVMMERDNQKMNISPMTDLLFSFLRTIRQFSIKKDFSFDDWINFLHFMNSKAAKEPFTSFNFEAGIVP